MPGFLIRTFPAFKYRNYNLYFFAQLVSLIGTWLQLVAESWLVLQLTNSAFMVGLIAAISFTPVLLFSLFGGVIVDRFPKRNLLIFTNILAMILALILGSLILFNLVTVWAIAILAFLLGIVNAIDMPARQSFTPDIVEREHLPSAIALNMGMFNASRVIGPAIAGALIQNYGAGVAYLLNGASFVAPIIALLLMRVNSLVSLEQPHPIEAIKIGLKYTYNHLLIRNLILFSAVLSIFGFSFNTILPVIAKDTFHQDAGGLGWMYTFAGIGAFVGTVLVAITAKRFKPITLIFAGSLGFVFSLLLLSFTDTFSLGLTSLFLQGVSMSFPFAMLMTSIQHHVEPQVRGRVMSIFTLAFLGMQPIGSFQVGLVAEHFGTAVAIQLGAFMVFLIAFYTYFSLRKLD